MAARAAWRPQLALAGQVGDSSDDDTTDDSDDDMEPPPEPWTPVQFLQRAHAVATSLVQLCYNTAVLAVATPYWGPGRRALPSPQDEAENDAYMRHKLRGKFFRTPYDFLFVDENESAVYDDVANFPEDLITGTTVDMYPPMEPIIPEMTDDEDELVAAGGDKDVDMDVVEDNDTIVAKPDPTPVAAMLEPAPIVEMPDEPAPVVAMSDDTAPTVQMIDDPTHYPIEEDVE